MPQPILVKITISEGFSIKMIFFPDKVQEIIDKKNYSLLKIVKNITIKLHVQGHINDKNAKVDIIREVEMRGTVRGDLKLFETHDCNINPTVNN